MKRPNYNRADHTTNFPPEEGRTRQSFNNDADINKIMGKWRKQGFFENVQLHTPVFGDFADVPDYLQAVNGIKSAEAIFASLPARVRKRVNNNPWELMDFVKNPENADELLKLGLVKPVSPEPAPPQVVPEPAVEEVTPPKEPS